MPNTIFSMHRDLNDATTTPVTDVAQLQGLWDREVGVYRMCVVRVTARQGSLISFQIVIGAAPSMLPQGTANGAAYTVDLNDGRNVWSELPSTAQLVVLPTTENIGYLGLNEDWLLENVGDSGGLRGGGDGVPKFPKNLSL